MEVHVSAVPPYFPQRLSVAVMGTHCFPLRREYGGPTARRVRPAAPKGYSPEVAGCLSPDRFARKDILSQTTRPDYSSSSMPLA